MEDRNSMAFSIEARVPYLDHRLVEFLLGVSSNVKLQKGQLKYLQKQALGKYSVSKIYEHDSKKQKTDEIYHCSYSKSKEKLKEILKLHVEGYILKD